MSTKVIIDTDVGVDDAIALFLALGAHKDPGSDFEIVGITTVLGNATVDNVAKNVFRVLDCVGNNDIPVYPGAANSLVPDTNSYEPTHFGSDGFGDVLPEEMASIMIEPNEKRQLEKEYAPLALARLAREHKGSLTVVALGPLTNVALTAKIDPDFVKNVKELYVMGGNLYAVGNVKPCTEFNFLVDPESAHIVLQAPWNNTVIIPWETCKEALPTLQWRFDVLGSLKIKPVQLMNLIEREVMKNIENWYGPGKWVSADCVCMAVLLKPDIVSVKSNKYCTVELHGSHTRGQMVVDHPQRSGYTPNVTIIEAVHTPEIEKMFLSLFNKL